MEMEITGRKERERDSQGSEVKTQTCSNDGKRESVKEKETEEMEHGKEQIFFLKGCVLSLCGKDRVLIDPESEAIIPVQ